MHANTRTHANTHAHTQYQNSPVYLASLGTCHTTTHVVLMTCDSFFLYRGKWGVGVVAPRASPGSLSIFQQPSLQVNAVPMDRSSDNTKETDQHTENRHLLGFLFHALCDESSNPRRNNFMVLELQLCCYFSRSCVPTPHRNHFLKKCVPRRSFFRKDILILPWFFTLFLSCPHTDVLAFSPQTAVGNCVRCSDKVSAVLCSKLPSKFTCVKSTRSSFNLL